jgi:hypothetical protein
MLNPRQILAFAPWQDVHFGSLADLVVLSDDIRFTPESGHEKQIFSTFDFVYN